MTVEIHKLQSQDIEKFVALIDLFERVFEMEDFSLPPRSYLEKVLARADFMAFVASAQSKVLGGLTVYVLEQYYSIKPLAYIYDLAVDTAYKRQGIGSKLVASVSQLCKEKGFEEIFVQAEKVDKDALDFYRATLLRAEEDVSYFHYKF